MLLELLTAVVAVGYDWSLETGSSTQIGTSTVWNGNTYVLTNGDEKIANQGLIMKINEKSGDLDWLTGIGIYSGARVPDPIVFEISPDAGLLIIVTSTPAQVQAFDATGESYYANWTFASPGAKTFSKAVIGDNSVIYVTSGPPPGHLFAINAITGPTQNGSTLWKQAAVTELSPPLYIPGFVMVTTRDLVSAYHSADGKPAWEHHIKGNPGVDSPTASYGSENLIFVSSMEGIAGRENPYHIYAIDASSGKQRWSCSGIGSYTVSTPVYSKLGIVIFTSWTDGGNITALNSSTGRAIWSHTDAHNLVNFSTPVIDEESGVLYVVASTSTPSISLWQFTLKEGTFTWQHSINTAASCATGDGCIFPIPSPPYKPYIDVNHKTAIVGGINRDVYAVSLPAAPSPDHTGAPSSESVPTYVGYIAAVSGVIVVSLVLCLPRWWCKGRDGVGQADSNQPPSPESRYTAIRKLGSGSYGTVYEVKCKKDGKLYALKRIPCDNETERTEAIREWRILCGIQHPNKIQAYETFMNWSTTRADEDDIANINTITHRRYVCIVMQYCPEGDLKNFIESFGPNQRIAESIVLSFAGQLCSVMSVLHAQVPPLIHRDLKPENVLLDEDNTKVIVTDFGLARPLSGSSYCKTHAGTLAFIAPETWDRHYSTGADMWGIGCIMYAMTTKKVSKENCRCLWREANEPEFQIGISDELVALGYSTTLANIVAQLLTPNRKRRPSAVQAFQWLHSYVPNYSKKFSLLGSEGPHEEVPVFVRAASKTVEGSDSVNHGTPLQDLHFDQSLPESHCQLDIAVDGADSEKAPLIQK